MTKTIVQKIIFRNVTADALYDLYMNARKHTMATGARAKITAKEGSRFSAHENYITGKNLQLIKNRLIVQSWRATDWEKEDADSTFIIYLEPKGKNTVLHATHANIPVKHVDGINKGWHQYYWEPWRKLLAGKPPVARRAM